MTCLIGRPRSGGEIKPLSPIPIYDEENNNKEFFIITQEEGERQFRIPFLVDYSSSFRPGEFKRLIALEHKSYKFYVITVNNQNSEGLIINESGKLRLTFDTQVYGVNLNKILEKKPGYQSDSNQVVVKTYDYEDIPNRPNYYNSRYRTLLPENFKIFRDQIYVSAGQEGVEFKGIFSLIDTEIRMPVAKKNGTYEFFSIARCYAAFQGLEVDHVYAVPIPKDMRCYVDENSGKIRMVDSTDDITFKVDSGELSVGEFKIITINIFKFRVIIAKDLKDAMINGLSRLRGLRPDER